MRLAIFHQQLEQAGSLKQLKQQLKNYLQQLSLSTYSFTYYSYHPRSKNKLKYDDCSENYKSWHQHYLSEQYNANDSTLDASYQHNLPLFWNLRQQLKEARTEKEKQMRLDSIVFGAEQGLSIPVHGPNDDFALFLLVQMKGESGLNDWSQLQYELLAAAHYYYQHVKRLLLINKPLMIDDCLSQREKQCLTLLAERSNVDLIAKKLEITKRTVNFHIQNINKKMGTTNKYESVAKAIEKGVICL